MLRLFVFLSIISLSSCQTKNKIPVGIIGDWVGNYYTSAGVNKCPVFSFNDSTGKLYVLTNVDIKYFVTGDKIIYRHTDSAINKPSGSFNIIKVTDDSLILKNNNGLAATLIQLKKIQPKNSIQPSKIYFASSGCFGPCPSMFIEIDSLGNLMFYGRSATKNIGYYSAKLNSEIFNTILRKLRNINFDSLKKKYEVNLTDDQTVGISVLAGNKEYTSTVYGYDKEPIELRILLNYLMELYQYIDLKKDSLTKEEYILKNKEFQKLMLEPAPPPLFDKKPFIGQ